MAALVAPGRPLFLGFLLEVLLEVALGAAVFELAYRPVDGVVFDLVGLLNCWSLCHGHLSFCAC